jgi:hypothetical protein
VAHLWIILCVSGVQGDRLQVESALEVDRRDNVPSVERQREALAGDVSCGGVSSRRLESRLCPTLYSTTALSHILRPTTASPEHDDDPTATHCNVGTRPCTAVISGTPTTAPAALLPLPLGASLVLLGPAVGIDKPDMLGGQGVIMGCAGGMQVAPIQVG